MKRFAFAALGGLMCACALSCQPTNDQTQDKLDEILTRLEAIEGRLSNGSRARPARRRPKRPDPNTTYAVPVNENDPFRGGPHAKVTMVEAYEFACPYCAMLQPEVQKLLKDYEDEELKVVSKQLVIHPKLASDAALATCAANNQGKFAAFEHALWEHAWEVAARPQLRRENLTATALEKVAASVGLDVERFKKDLAGPACRKEIARQRAELAQLGINWTPQIYINGRPYQGPRTAAGFKRVIDAEIAKADTAIARGVPLERYYQTLIADGKKTL